MTNHHNHQWGSGGGVGGSVSKGGEIERIMAKIEQDNRILAELDHSRSTTLGATLATSASSHALGECSPPISPITMSHTTPSIYPTGYQTYLPTNTSNYNPSSIFNPLPSTTYKTNFLGTSLGTGSVLGAPTLSSLVPMSYNTTTFTNPLITTNTTTTQFTSNYLPTVSATYNPITTTTFTNNVVTFSNPLSSQFNSLPLSGPVGMSIKLKPLEEVELGN